MNRAPLSRRAATAATDESPVYSTGRGNELSAVLLGDLEGDAERRSTLYVQLNPKSNQACAALRSGDRVLAASLFNELTDAWRAGGFPDEAKSCESLAHAALNPPTGTAEDNRAQQTEGAMMAEPFFTAENAVPLLPLGTCSMCGTQEDPLIAVFWRNDEFGAVCPTCAGEEPGEGYDFVVFVDRTDRGNIPPSMHGPYSAVEAERVRGYFLQLGNVKDARVARKLGA